MAWGASWSVSAAGWRTTSSAAGRMCSPVIRITDSLGRSEERKKLWSFTSVLIFSHHGVENVRTFLNQDIGECGGLRLARLLM